MQLLLQHEHIPICRVLLLLKAHVVEYHLLLVVWNYLLIELELLVADGVVEAELVLVLLHHVVFKPTHMIWVEHWIVWRMMHTHLILIKEIGLRNVLMEGCITTLAVGVILESGRYLKPIKGRLVGKVLNSR